MTYKLDYVDDEERYYPEYPDVRTLDMRLQVVQDDTTTVATLQYVDANGDSGGVVGEGRARRRKGDRRNSQLGLTLAIRRAYRDALVTEELAYPYDEG